MEDKKTVETGKVTIESKAKNIIGKITFITTIAVIGALGYFVYDETRSAVVLDLADQIVGKYMDMESAKVLNNYEKEGQTIYIIRIENKMCEMAVIRDGYDFIASKFKCN